MSVFTGGSVPPIVQEMFAASIFCGVSSGQHLQQNSAQTLLRQHSAFCNFSCRSDKIANIYRLLTILGTLPVTTSKSERVVSKLQ